MHDFLLDCKNRKLTPEEALQKMAGGNFESDDAPFNHGVSDPFQACGITAEDVASAAAEIDFGEARSVSKRVEAIENGIKRFPQNVRRFIMLALLSPPKQSQMFDEAI